MSRNFLPTLLLALLLGSAPVSLFGQSIAPYGALPTPAQVNWQDLGFYWFIHFGPNTFTNEEWGHGTEDPNLFNPTQLDCRQWARLAKASGAKGIILTAKHHDGFCLFPSQYSTHTVRESKWMNGKGDVVKLLSDACKEYGLLFGVYISPWDRNHPAYGTSVYNDVYVNTLKELLTGYGQLFELWWDGANGEGPNGKKQAYDFPRFRDTVYKYQPHTIIFSDIGPGARWCGNESGTINTTNWNTLDTTGFGIGALAPAQSVLNQGVEGGEAWIPAESDISIRPGWFYHNTEDGEVKSAKQLFRTYLQTAGRGGNLLLNVPPDRRGLIAAPDSAALVAFGQLRAKAFAVNLAKKARITAADSHSGTNSSFLNDGKEATFWSPATSDSAATLLINFRKATSLNCVQLQEYVQLGQRIKAFTISYMDGQEEKVLAIGTTIGFRRIVTFSAVKTSLLKIRITESNAVPVLSEVGIYSLPEELVEQ